MVLPVPIVVVIVVVDVFMARRSYCHEPLIRLLGGFR